MPTRIIIDTYSLFYRSLEDFNEQRSKWRKINNKKGNFTTRRKELTQTGSCDCPSLFGCTVHWENNKYDVVLLVSVIRSMNRFMLIYSLFRHALFEKYQQLSTQINTNQNIFTLNIFYISSLLSMFGNIQN